MGFVYPAVDSDGRIYKWPTKKDRPRNEFTIAGPVTVKKPSGESVVEEAYDPRRIDGIVEQARGVEYKQRVLSVARQVVAAARQSDRGLVLEDWEDFKFRRATWVDVYLRILDRAKASGVSLKTVNRAYTSQTCPECGHIARGNRPDREHFKCLDCGFEGQADAVAARNMVASQKVLQDHSGVCGNPVCERPVWKAGKCCACYFHQRRYGVLPNRARLERLALAKSYRAFKAGLENPVVDEDKPFFGVHKGATERALEARYDEACGFDPDDDRLDDAYRPTPKNRKTAEYWVRLLR